MSRLTQNSNYQQNNSDIQDNNEEVIYDRIVLNKPKEYDNTERILLVDGDSLFFLASYFPPESLIEFPTDELQLEEAKYRLKTKIQEITNNVEEWYNIKQTLIFIGGKNNFRYNLYPAYKANRKDKEISPLIPLLKEYMINEIPNVIEAHGSEADDQLYEAYKITQGNCIVSAIDKDLFFNCHSTVIYDYRSYKSKELENTTIVGNFKYTTEKESRLARANHLVVGDASDGVNFCPKKGEAWCKKNLHEDMTDYQFIKTIYKCYIDAWKGDVILAKNNLKLCYKLLKLWTKDELKTLNL